MEWRKGRKGCYETVRLMRSTILSGIGERESHELLITLQVYYCGLAVLEV
jgi:hypothetical protein